MRLTVEELIEELEKIKEKRGPHTITNIEGLREHLPIAGLPKVDLIQAN